MTQRGTCRIRILLVSLVSVAAFLVMPRMPQSITDNLWRISIITAWRSVRLKTTQLDALQDGIPDGWVYRAWDKATQIYLLDEQEAFSGERAVRVERTNTSGGTALSQDVAVESGSHLVCTVYAKGDNGAIHLWFRADGKKDWLKEGWIRITASDDWQLYRLTVTAPPRMTEARLLLQAMGLIWFDETYVGVKKDGQLGPNLLKNPDFEHDGLSEEPLGWWQRYVVSRGLRDIPEDSELKGLAFLNIADMLNGRYDAIQQRAFQLGDTCATVPEMNGWLITLGEDFERAGGAAAQEQLYQLAIALAPNCPQSYAVLAELYRSHKGFWRATELYHQAAALAGDTSLAGRYFFEEGFLHVRYTGDLERAVSALQRAERLHGWEGGGWYQGAASLYLGQALEAQEHFADAAAAYQRVVACRECSYHRAIALERLNSLSSGEFAQ